MLGGTAAVACGVWVAGMAGSVLSVCAPAAASALVYGKVLPDALAAAATKQRAGAAAAADVPAWWQRGVAALARLTVPKRAFTAFYVVGAATALAAATAVWRCAASTATAALILAFALHCGRRLWECLAIHQWSPTARMPAHLFVAGLAHYLLAPWCLVVTLPPGGAPAWWAEPRTIGGLGLVVVASLVQTVAHMQLADLRPGGRGEGGGGGYALPTGSTFRISWSPHYTAEVAMYIGFAVAAANPLALSLAAAPPWLLAAWVAANLSATALHTKAWYAATFPAASATIASRAAIFPGLL